MAVPLGTPAAAWNDDYRSYSNPNNRINDFQRRDFNPLSYNYIPKIEPPSFSPYIQTFTMPDLAINMHTMKMPEIFVRDIGSDMFAYKWEANNFNPTVKGYDHYQANIRFDIGGQLAPNSVSMDLGKMKFDQGSQIPKSYTRLYQDTQGNSFKIDRFNQTGNFNPSYNSFKQFYQRQEQMSQYAASERPTGTKPKPPTMELLEGFDEKWTLSTQDPVQGHQAKDYEIRIDSIKNDSNLKRFVSEYSGVIKTAGSAIEFTVKSPHESDGRILSLDITLKGKGAPSATITWKPADGVDGGEAFKLIRDNVPAPLMVGPRASFRLNDVDIAESPLKVRPDGNISSKQVGDVKDLANLMGRQDLGINVSFSPPASDSPNAGFSLMNGLRNLGYMLTGRWSDVKGMRQELSGMQKQDPGKFVLAAGFNDPGFMRIKDLKAAIQKISPDTLKSSLDQEQASKISLTGSVFRGIGRVFKGAYETVRAGVELVSDFARGTWEAVVGTTVAVGQLIAPALPFISAVTAAITPVGAAVSAVLLSGNYIAGFREVKKGEFKNGADLFFGSTTKKLANAWKGYGVLFSDDIRAFGQRDNKVTIGQSLLNIVSMVPVIGNLVPGSKAKYDQVVAIVYTRGIHANDQDTTKFKGRGFVTELGKTFQLKAVNMDYPYGNVTDVAMSLLNIEHSASYDEAWKFLGTGTNEQGKGYVLIGHSGGVQRSGYMSKILGGLGYGTALLIGVAGPLGGAVPSMFGNVNEIHLMGSKKEDPISWMAWALGRTPRDASGNPAQRKFDYGGGGFSHQDPGADPVTNPYRHDIEKFIREYMSGHPGEFR